MNETAEQSLDGIIELSAVDFKTWQAFEPCPTSLSSTLPPTIGAK